MAEMRKITAYFSLLCEESKWDANAERIFDELFHPDLQITGTKEKFDFHKWKAWYKRSIEDGLILDMEKVVRVAPDEIVYTLLVHQDDGSTLEHTAKGIFKDGKMIKTIPVNPGLYDIMTKKKKRKPVCIL